MILDCTFDDSVLQRRLGDLLTNPAKNLAYSVQQALNDTVKEIQVQERVGIDRAGFHLRKTQFIYNLIKIFQFAKAKDAIPYAEIGIDTAKAGVLLSMFEAGGTKEPTRGENVAVPLTGEAARPTAMAIVPTNLRFPALKFVRQDKIFVGRQNTYLIPGVGIFQYDAAFSYIGKGGRVYHSRLIYAFEKSVPIKRKLRFAAIAQETFDRVFRVKFTERFSRTASGQ